ncbi:aminoglycoside phosphotransferase family protein [Octadecabacter sp. G9-8]|uniref:Aminoglycoside phosphotransferase family protein n=1 Tax=Octadecabacter dasysiphoniae TaxID=2909341 RepID=A0ABS9CR44_9RHOB|nr:aminoglycoside phosphotransferase family protein [Octadecabacter dasysiphoniae]MCF2869653.1 aminoglycoside phosphotransferase family protein [Octadecabacter dasysiphoniae]
MTQPSAIIDSRVNAMIREFADHRGFVGMPEHRVIYRSYEFPKTRQVWKVELGAEAFALKLDYEADSDGRLAKEFRELQNLSAHFAKYDKLGIATPVYLSPTGTFCVTEFLDHKTAGERLQAVESDQTRRQVFRRAGLWLHAMHEYEPQKRKEFWGNWMVKELDEIVARGEMQAPADDVAYMRAILHEQTRKVNRIRDTHATSHGDFHGENIMLGPGMTYGFDFTEARAKMAVYDVVDFLKVDIYRDTPVAEIDNTGITKAHRDMFFKGYKHKIDKGVLDVSLRGRLLLDWASITRESHAKIRADRILYRNLKPRLDIAFAKA